MNENEKFDKRLDNYIWNSLRPYKASGINNVFLGKDLLIDRPVIIKALPINQFTDEFILNNLLTEWQKIQSLKSPFLCEIYNILLTRNNLYIFEEYCPQGNLRQFFIENLKEKEKKIAQFLNDIIKAFEFLAKNQIFHGNLKPENILISNNLVKINDFGFKHHLFRKNPNHLYQSPAQLSNKTKFPSIKDDVWAIGCIYYEILFGKTPFFGLTEAEMIKNLKKNEFFLPESAKNPQIEEFIEGILRKSEEKRWNFHDILSSNLVKTLRENEVKNKPSLNDLDYNAKSILMNLEQTIRKNHLDLEALFLRFDSSGDQSIDLKEFLALLRIVDPKLTIIQIERVFNMIDCDGSGSISLEELKDLMGFKSHINEGFIEDREMEVKIGKMMYVLRETINRNGLNLNAIFARYDNSGDMNLDKLEFFSLLKDISPIEEEMSDYLFRKLDFDGSGDINFNEFRSYVMEDTALQKKLKDLEEKTQEMVMFLRNLMYGQKLDMKKLFARADRKGKGKINEEEFKELIEVIDKQVKIQVVRHFFKKIDKDGSGFIEYEEFASYLK